ncbi:GAF domain-containing protein [Candidatus Riflebacteria bacterium]
MQEDLNKKNQLLEAITLAQSQYISENEPMVLFTNLLQNILNVTDSKYGFIGEVFYQSNGRPFLKTHAISNIAWNKETIEFYKKNAPSGMEFRNLKTLFGGALTSKKLVISNEPGNDPRAGGLPQGHPPLNAFLGIPLLDGNRLVGMLGIANRPDGYDEKIVEFLKPLLLTITNIIKAVAAEKKRQQAEEKLMENNSILKVIAETTQFCLVYLDANFNFKWVNMAYAETCQLDPEYFPGKNIFALFPDVENQAIFQRVVDSGESHTVHAKSFKCPNMSESTYWDWTLHPVKSTFGRVDGLILALLDVTERKKS